ncbi:hypothetical protein NC652_007785 [Populus alba x Populus x berolinensis]|nr:hypothetical protein NC652_007785 [Populus alba x Populus x berolinensis]
MGTLNKPSWVACKQGGKLWFISHSIGYVYRYLWESLHKVLNKELKNGQSVIDILEINRLRIQLLFQSYMWDNRLDRRRNPLGPANSGKLIEENVDAKLLKASNQQGGFGSNTNQCDAVGQEIDVCQGPSHERGQATPFAAMPARDLSDVKESGGNFFRTLSDGQDPVMANLSIPLMLHGQTMEESSTTAVGLEGVGLEGHVEDQVGSKVCYSPSPAFSTKDPDNMEDSMSWLRMPFLNFYRPFNNNCLTSSEKLDRLREYNPVYISSFRKLKFQDQARLLLPVGVNDTVNPVYDDEPTSLISYALVSQEYHAPTN